MLTHADVYAPQVLIDPHTGKPRVNEKTKQPLTRKDLGISTHPSLNLDKSRKSRAHLPDEQVLLRAMGAGEVRAGVAALVPGRIAAHAALHPDAAGCGGTDPLHRAPEPGAVPGGPALPPLGQNHSPAAVILVIYGCGPR